MVSPVVDSGRGVHRERRVRVTETERGTGRAWEESESERETLGGVFPRKFGIGAHVPKL